jgi:hypothetical protein
MLTRSLPERIIVERKRTRRESWPGNALPREVLLESGGYEAAAFVDAIVCIDCLNEPALDAAPMSRETVE